MVYLSLFIYCLNLRIIKICPLIVFCFLKSKIRKRIKLCPSSRVFSFNFVVIIFLFGFYFVAFLTCTVFFLVISFLCSTYLCFWKKKESFGSSHFPNKKKLTIGVENVNCYKFWLVYRNDYYNISNRSTFWYIKNTL